MNFIELKKEIEKKYKISLELDSWGYFDYPSMTENARVRFGEDVVEVSIDLELDYRDELDTEKVLAWVKEKIRFYFFKDSFTLTKTFDESDDVSLEKIENWIKETYDRGI